MYYKRESIIRNSTGTYSCTCNINGRTFIVDGDSIEIVKAGIKIQKAISACN